MGQAKRKRDAIRAIEALGATPREPRATSWIGTTTRLPTGLLTVAGLKAAMENVWTRGVDKPDVMLRRGPK